MQRLWGLLFLLVPLVCGTIYLLAALGIRPFAHFWLPPDHSVDGASIDRLFVLTHIVAGVVLLGVTAALTVLIWAGASRGRTISTTSHHTLLEVVWTLIPAAILVGLAMFQFQSWNEHKLLHPQIDVDGQWVAKPPLVRVIAKRFGWEFCYAGRDGILGTPDDLFVENLLVLPADEDIVLEAESRDVIHSFFVPGLRLKQDVVPGLPQHLWFRAARPVELEIVCAELCGWGHFTMQARLRLVSRQDFDRWIDEQILQRRGQGGSAAP